MCQLWYSLYPGLHSRVGRLWIPKNAVGNRITTTFLPQENYPCKSHDPGHVSSSVDTVISCSSKSRFAIAPFWCILGSPRKVHIFRGLCSSIRSWEATSTGDKRPVTVVDCGWFRPTGSTLLTSLNMRRLSVGQFKEVHTSSSWSIFLPRRRCEQRG